jgi:hypothetical protein
MEEVMTMEEAGRDAEVLRRSGDRRQEARNADPQAAGRGDAGDAWALCRMLSWR